MYSSVVGLTLYNLQANETLEWHVAILKCLISSVPWSNVRNSHWIQIEPQIPVKDHTLFAVYYIIFRWDISKKKQKDARKNNVVKFFSNLPAGRVAVISN